MRIFHGSDKQITVEFGKGKNSNDYGKAFYCTEDEHQAKLWAVSKNGWGYVYEYSIDTEGLKVLEIDENNVLLWIASVLCLILSFAFFSTAGAIVSGIVYLLTCIIVNPLFCKFVNKNLFRMPVWVCAVVFVVGFCVGAALL